MAYAKTLLELQRNAILWWPQDLLEEVAEASPIPLLIESQDDFISILKLSGKAPDQIFDVIRATGMPVNIFVKHLAIMADFGGEPLKRLGSGFKEIFPANKAGKHVFRFVFREKSCVYEFEELPINNLSNTKLFLDGNTL